MKTRVVTGVVLVALISLGVTAAKSHSLDTHFHKWAKWVETEAAEVEKAK